MTTSVGIPPFPEPKGENQDTDGVDVETTSTLIGLAGGESRSIRRVEQSKEEIRTFQIVLQEVRFEVWGGGGHYGGKFVDTTNRYILNSYGTIEDTLSIRMNR